jgi:hypothetical protein
MATFQNAFDERVRRDSIDVTELPEVATRRSPSIELSADVLALTRRALLPLCGRLSSLFQPLHL